MCARSATRIFVTAATARGEGMKSKSCACRSTDARRCYEIRYPPPMDDFDRVDYFARLQEDGDECECGCHEPDYRDEDDDGEPYVRCARLEGK